MRRILTRIFGPTRGQALVEFSLVLPLLLLVLFAIVDFGRVFNAWIIVTNAAREGARCAVLGAPESAVIDRTLEAADSLGGATPVVSVTNAAGPAGESVVVDVDYDADFVTPFASILNFVSGGTFPETLTVSSSTDMRIEGTGATSC